MEWNGIRPFQYPFRPLPHRIEFDRSKDPKEASD